MKNFNFTHYYPNTENRIEYLRKVVGGRMIAILLHGPSIKELSEKIDELKNYDLCYFSLNAFRLLEDSILAKINKHLSVATTCAADNWIYDIVEFLDRPEDNLFVSTSEYIDRSSEKGFIEKYDKKLMTVLGYQKPLIPENLPNKDWPLHMPPGNTLTGVLALSIIAKPAGIILFGADGGGPANTNLKDLYFKGDYPESFFGEHRAPISLSIDASVFNKFVPHMIKNVCKLYDINPIDIINCSINSNYNVFPKYTYNQTFKFLKENYK